MPEINSSQGFDIEAMINNVASDMAEGDIHDKKATMASIRSNTDKIRDQRLERIENLQKQLKGVASGGGACFKGIKVVLKVIDILAKPLSLLTLGNLQTSLSKTLDMLQQAKAQGKLMGMKIDGQQIMKTLESLKTNLSEDTEQLKQQNQHSQQETEKIMSIIDEISNTFKSTNNV